MRSRTLGYRSIRSVEVRHVDRVAQKWLVDGHTRPIDQQEMDLVDVEGVQFVRAVLDDPVLHVALLDDDLGAVGRRIEGRGCLAVDGEVEVVALLGLLGSVQLLGEIELRVRDRRATLAEPRQRGRRQGLRGMPASLDCGSGASADADDGGERAIRIVFAAWPGIDGARHEAARATPAGGPSTMNSTRAPGGTPM